MALSIRSSMAPSKATPLPPVSNLPSTAQHGSTCTYRTFKPYHMSPSSISVKAARSGLIKDIWTTKPAELLSFASQLSQLIDLPRSGLGSMEVLLRRYTGGTALTICNGVHYIFSYCTCVKGSRRPYLWCVTQPRSLEKILAILRQTDSDRIRVLEDQGLKVEMVPF